MLKFTVSLFLVLISFTSVAAGPLDAAVRDIDRWSKLEELTDNKALKRDMLETSNAIKRAALIQSIQADSLAKRIAELEETVKNQQIIIAQYEEIIARLKPKNTGDGK